MHPVPVNGEGAQILVKLFENLSVIAGAMPPPLIGEAGKSSNANLAPLPGELPLKAAERLILFQYSRFADF